MFNRNGYNKYLMGFIIAAVCALICLAAIILRYGCPSNDGQAPSYEPPAFSDFIPTPQAESNTVTVTIPEGFNVMQIAARLEESGVCSADEFTRTMNTVDFSDEYPFLPPVSTLSQRVYYLEGYLFPDTYEFYKNDNPESVISRFLDNFKIKVTQEYMDMAAHTGEFYNQQLTFDDVLIMASIVEKEISSNPSEMRGVAAVFYNRLKYPGGTAEGSATGGYFQSDATKFYPYIYGATPEGFVSEYDTFKVKGFPKGPLCCPSLDAIKASLNPDTTNESFFFYTDKNYKVYYAVTFNEHQNNYKYCVDNGLAP